MEDAAELEKLSKEKKLDKMQKDCLTRLVGDISSSEKLESDDKDSNPISSKQQVKQEKNYCKRS